MRFLLLARARTTGRIRLLSDRAFDSRSAAVDAAAVTAVGLALADDEVLAVDLESADPVLVLRIGPVVDVTPEAIAIPAVSGPEAVASSGDSEPETVASPVATEPEARAVFAPLPAPPARERPYLPLFGAPDDVTPCDDAATEDLAETLRRVARRMEADLAGETYDDRARFDDDWDARTFDDYGLPDDGSFRAASEEGRTRGDAARASDVDESDAAHGDAAVSCDEARDCEWDGQDAGPDDRSVDTPSATGGCADAPAAWGEWWDPREAGAAPSDRELPDVAVSDGTLDADRVENPVVAWEPPEVFYRPASTDFAVWVCADCVYQRTCRKAGTATPASCGNFLWRSR